MSDNCCSESKCSGRGMKIALVMFLLLAIAGVLYVKSVEREKVMPETPTPVVAPTQGEPAANAVTPAVQPVEKETPKLVDLGAKKCIPCKMMAPILEELKKEYQGKMEVVFIDVWENRQAADDYNVETIPTQIFFDPGGKELFRHIGFFSKKEILAKWQELGYDFSSDIKEKP